MRLSYVPALDGLRALAVLSVLVMHAALPGFGWGFLGVDVFFVLSGFLITTLLLEEWHRTGHIDLRAFYLRRLRRLMPALVGVVVAVAVYSVTLAPEPLAARNRVGIVASLLYVSNWVVALSDQHLGQLQHTWSLAIEEQFYLVWPVILLLLLRRGWAWPRLALATGGLALASALWRAHVWREATPWRTYAASDTRADGLLLGCLLALLLAHVPALRTRWSGLALPAMLAGFALLVGTGATYHTWWLYRRGGLTAIALGSALLILLTVTRAVPALTTALSWAPLVVIGRISYGLYLWHYVIFRAAEVPVATLPVAERLGWLALPFLAAGVSWYVIERPFLRRRAPTHPSAPVAAVVAVVVVAT